MPKQKGAASNLLEVQNAAKTMFANIGFQSIDKEICSIMLTSSVPDEGKTTTAWYLAQAAATSGKSVLMIEGDMRRRSLASMLQLHPQNGLFSVLSGTSKLVEAVVETSVRGLYFLDAEPSIPNPADLLASKRMKEFNEKLRGYFDYVIYDTPPVGTFVDAAVLGRIVDAVVLVVRPGRVKRSELVLAYEQLASAEANIVGICNTFVEGTGSEYYYYYYTKDSKHGSKKNASSKAHVNDAGTSADVARAQMKSIDAPEPSAEKRTGGSVNDAGFRPLSTPRASHTPADKAQRPERHRR